MLPEKINECRFFAINYDSALRDTPLLFGTVHARFCDLLDLLRSDKWSRIYLSGLSAGFHGVELLFLKYDA